MEEMAIKTEALTRRFKSVTALEDLTLEVPRGIIFGFLGPNGAGKTTAIRLLLGILEPTSGRASVMGHDTRSQAEAVRQSTGALLEHNGLYERLSAEDNLEFYARVWGLSAGERRARLRELLTHFGLWERRHESTGTWSRGMKQKLAVARAMLHRPPLIFLDEPTAGLDPVAAVSLRDDLRALADREGTTVFLTTHNLDEAEKICTQVGVIRRGRLQAVGSPAELRARRSGGRLEIRGSGLDDRIIAQLRARPEVSGVFAADGGGIMIDLHEGAPAAPLVKFLVEEGAGLEEVRRSQISLEEVFLDLVKEEHQ